MRHDLPDIYDDRPLRGPRPPRRWPAVFAAIALLALVAAAAFFFLYVHQRATPPRAGAAPVHVVGDRPGGGASRAEAVRRLRNHLAQTQSIAPDCVAAINTGSSGSVYYFTAVNRCDRTRLGRWQVDAKSGVISRRTGSF